MNADLSQLLDDLQTLLDAMQHPSMPAKPWARQLRLQMQEAARCLEVLRMALVMGKPADVLSSAAADLQREIKIAAQSIAKTRADETSRAGVQLAHVMMQRVRRALGPGVS